MKKVIVYVHEESQKVVSKVCHGCGEIKLTEDFAEKNGKAFYTSLCNECEKGEVK